MASPTAAPRGEEADDVVVVLLRGVNVGGKNKLPMALLRETCESLGCTDVSTYIQSGNVVLRSTTPPAELATKLEAALGVAVSFTPRVVTRSAPLHKLAVEVTARNLRTVRKLLDMATAAS